MKVKGEGSALCGFSIQYRKKCQIDKEGAHLFFEL